MTNTSDHSRFNMAHAEHVIDVGVCWMVFALVIICDQRKKLPAMFKQSGSLPHKRATSTNEDGKDAKSSPAAAARRLTDSSIDINDSWTSFESLMRPLILVLTSTLDCVF